MKFALINTFPTISTDLLHLIDAMTQHGVQPKPQWNGKSFVKEECNSCRKNHTIGLGKIWCDFQHFGKWMSLVNNLWLLLPKSFNTGTVTVFENNTKKSQYTILLKKIFEFSCQKSAFHSTQICGNSRFENPNEIF